MYRAGSVGAMAPQGSRPRALLWARSPPLCLCSSSSSSPSPSTLSLPSALPGAQQSPPAASCCWSLPARLGLGRSMRRGVQRVMGLFSKQGRQSPSGSASGQPCAAATVTGAYELREKDLGRLHHAAARGNLAWLRRWRWWLKRVGIIDRRDQEKRTPLHLACANGHADVVRFLVQENCQLNLADNFKRSPLMKAVQCQQEECVAILLEHGADPNLADVDGNTALHLAVLSPHTTVAGLLLEHNANTDAQNQEGYTPFNLAVAKHHERMVEFLQRKGAGGHAQDQRESKLLPENMDGENIEEASAGGAADKAVLSSSCPVRTPDFTRDALAQDGEGAPTAGGAEQEEDALSPGDFEDWVTQLQQKLADALQQQSMSEASLEVTMRYHSDLEEDKLCLQQELDRVEAELRELEEQHLQSERCVHDLKTALDNKEREVIASSQKLQDLLLASSGTNTTIKQLEEHVQRLEIENARLEATVQQQSNRIEALQRDLQASASVQKQNAPARTSKDSRSMWEEKLKSRSHLEEHATQLDREKAEPLEQHDRKGRQAERLIEGICKDEVHLCEELRINFELKEDCKRLKRLLSRAVKKLSVYEEREVESQLSLQGEMKNNCSETGSEGGRLRTKLKRQRYTRSEDAGAEKSQCQKSRSRRTETKCLPSTD